eukprot:NODE_2442_length_1199_cov_33.070435_g2227_i0.p1 GENE.NODE_2442_length_1199_cov_33.070435_g2227_i0~~NODE_2442_length_1199_cov_33.070435_g2227_i0.p1  ORF type:complete len:238 (+),score=65.37 NODE_2442_length_1199_cov_33.070435_g2227_i0:137-850(+)
MSRELRSLGFEADDWSLATSRRPVRNAAPRTFYDPVREKAKERLVDSDGSDAEAPPSKRQAKSAAIEVDVTSLLPEKQVRGRPGAIYTLEDIQNDKKRLNQLEMLRRKQEKEAEREERIRRRQLEKEQREALKQIDESNAASSEQPGVVGADVEITRAASQQLPVCSEHLRQTSLAQMFQRVAPVKLAEGSSEAASPTKALAALPTDSAAAAAAAAAAVEAQRVDGEEQPPPQEQLQ